MLISLLPSQRRARAFFLAAAVTLTIFGLPGGASAEDTAPPALIARAIRQGSEIEYLGIIENGSAIQLQKVLIANPRATVLHLNSPGGDLTEAYRMADLVRPRQMTTTIDKFCDLACTIVFLSGKTRLIAPMAKIGFHRPWIAGMSDAETDIIIQRDRRYLAKLGIPNWFVDKAYSTPNSSAWYPTTTELTAAGVINGISDKYVISVGRFSNPVDGDELAFAEFMAAAEQYDPSGYQTIHQHLLKSLTDDELSYSLATDSALADFIVGHAAHAEDRPLLAYAQVFSNILSTLAQENPAACYTALAGAGSRRGDFTAAIGPEDAHRLSLAMLRAATNGVRNNVSAPSAQAVARSTAEIWSNMLVKFPQEAAAYAHPQPDNHADYCHYYAHMTAEIMLLPPDERAPVVRYLMAGEPGSGGDSASTSSSVPAWTLRAHPDK